MRFYTLPPVRFYTLPPSRCSWPYLLVNPNNYKILFKTKFEHAILDCGVEIFKANPNLKDYPKTFLEQWKHKAIQLTEIFKDKIWITIPDYPDDCHPGQFGDNVNKTLKNIEQFITINKVNWLIPIQSRYLNKFSFLESCQKLHDLVGDYPRIAIGTVCKTNNLDFINYCCKVARAKFPKSWIHAFGLTLKGLPGVKNDISSWDSLVLECGRKKWRKWLINSFDSLAYTFSLNSRTDKNGGLNLMCKNKKERQLFFNAYVKRIEEILNG